MRNLASHKISAGIGYFLTLQYIYLLESWKVALFGVLVYSIAMSLVTIKNKYQIVIPAKVRREAGLNVGDFLEASVKNGTITLSPKTLLDREIALSLEDFRQGRTSGPFNTAEELISYLKKEVKKIRSNKTKRVSR